MIYKRRFAGSLKITWESKPKYCCGLSTLLSFHNQRHGTLQPSFLLVDFEIDFQPPANVEEEWRQWRHFRLKLRGFIHFIDNHFFHNKLRTEPNSLLSRLDSILQQVAWLVSCMQCRANMSNECYLNTQRFIGQILTNNLWPFFDI